MNEESEPSVLEVLFYSIPKSLRRPFFFILFGTALHQFDKAMAAGIYNVPVWYSEWALASKGVTGQSGAPLPDGGKQLVLNARFPVDSLCKK